MENNISNTIINSYQTLVEYHRQIKEVYKFTDVRIALDEHGVSLKPILKNKLFGLSEEGMLYGDAFSPWISPWYGRFYIDARCVPEGLAIDDCSGKNVQYLAFVWNWVGCNDVHVPPRNNLNAGLASLNRNRKTLPPISVILPVRSGAISVSEPAKRRRTIG